MLLDAGSGAVGNLQTAIPYAALDAIVISHMHADHFFDLVPLRYGLTYGPFRRATRLPLWLPPNGSPTLRAIAVPFAREGGDFFGDVFDVREYDPKAALEIGDLALTFAPALHYIEAYAIRAGVPGATFAYSGDTAPCDAVVGHARGAALFVCEATLGLGSESPPRGHCSAREAGAMARQAGVEHLALTHYYSDVEPTALAAAARREFAGPISVLDDGDELSLMSS